MLFVGIDPVLDSKIKDKKNIELSLRNFALDCILATFETGQLGVKFQSAYFEQYGSLGTSILAEAIIEAKKLNLIVILDGKRGDIDRTSAAYAKGYLSKHSDFSSDFLTVNPFLGIEDSVLPFVKTAVENGKGVFVLVKTSNFAAETLQSFKNDDGKTLSEFLAVEIQKINQSFLNKNYVDNYFGLGYGPVGAVIAANKPTLGKHFRKLMPNTWFLCPGIGTQNGKVEDIRFFLNEDKKGAWFPISSGLTQVTKKEIFENKGLKNAIKQRILNLVSKF